MRRFLTTAVCSVAVCATALACDEPPAPAQTEAEQRFVRSHAARHGRRQAQHVLFWAQEISQLHPHSERSKRSREARELLDEIVPRETPEDEAAP